MDNKWLLIGLAAIGALFLLPKKKRARRTITSMAGIDIEYFRQRLSPLTEKQLVDLYNAHKDRQYRLAKGLNQYKREYKGQSRKPPEYIIRESQQEINEAKSIVNAIKKELEKRTSRQMTLFGGLSVLPSLQAFAGTGTRSAISLDVKKRCSPDITRKKIRCRVQQPKEFDGFFTRQSTTPGVSYVMGLVDGKGITQSVMFDKKIWDTRLAKMWFNKNINRLLERDRKALNLS